MKELNFPKITIADKQDTIDFLKSIKRTDKATYQKLIKRIEEMKVAKWIKL